MEDKPPQQTGVRFRVMDGLLITATLVLSGYAFLISGGWKLIESEQPAQTVARESQDCPPCEAAKREKQRVALDRPQNDADESAAKVVANNGDE